jgi:hypothetical protein
MAVAAANQHQVFDDRCWNKVQGPVDLAGDEHECMLRSRVRQIGPVHIGAATL